VAVPALNTSRLSEAQVQIARLIEREFAAAGFSPYVAAAAVANAYAESRFNPAAVGDKGASVGLFQLHERGAGAGMSVEARKDPTTNTRRIIETARRSGPFMALAASSTSVGDLAAAFSTYVERPADRLGAETARRGYVAYLYTLADAVSLPSIPALATVPSLTTAGRSTDRWLPALGIALASIVIAVYIRRRRAQGTIVA
jgi:hypothetical protein